MNYNYRRMENFLSYIKCMAMYNPDKEIDSNFIYSQLCYLDTELQRGYPLKNAWTNLENIYRNNPHLHLISNGKFLAFQNGPLNGNEIKIYVPLGANHLQNGVKMILDFLIATGIKHQTKIPEYIRSDDVVIRVNTLEEAEKVRTFLHNNQYIMDGMLNVNPFLANDNGLGFAMDNNYSFNSIVSKKLNEYLHKCLNENINDFNLPSFNRYLKKTINYEYDLDAKDVVSLLIKTTSPDFQFSQFISHARAKAVDKYSSDRKRIVNPNYYLEEAVNQTYRKYPQNVRAAIISYADGNPNYFTNDNLAREGLIKYVSPQMVYDLLRSKLLTNGYQVPANNGELVDNYLSITVYKTQYLFNIIVNAYLNTKTVYDEYQASGALRKLMINGQTIYFTNRYGDRELLERYIYPSQVYKILRESLDTNGLYLSDDVTLQNIDLLITRFDEIFGNRRKM